MWVRNTTYQIRLQTSDFIPIAATPTLDIKQPGDRRLHWLPIAVSWYVEA